MIKIEKYDDRETTPLTFHKVLNTIQIVIGAFCIVLAMLLSMMMIQDEFINELNIATEEVGLGEAGGFIMFVLIAFCTASGCIHVMTGYLGKKYKPAYLFALGLLTILTAALSVLSLISQFTLMNLFSTVLILAASGYIVFYYIERRALFAANYDENHGLNQPENEDEQEKEEING